nr:cytochrome c3 family protein [uncultured Desulfuromonas sp.]
MKKSLFLILLSSIALSSAYGEADYSTSAHGDPLYGVERSGLDNYSQGNCAHCHEQHASIGADSAENFMVFSATDGENTAPYTEAENFCFQCHSSTVVNYDYSTVFSGHSEPYGSGGSTAESIMEAFNKSHSHDLNDVYNHAILNADEFPWFKEGSNPCTACHNPHLARRNHSDPEDPTLTVMSMPDEHLSLYGDGDGDGDSSDGDEGGAVSERMSKWSGSPIYIAPTGEPAAADTPDYNQFCLYCHASSVLISNDDRPYYHGGVAGQLLAIKWLENGGDGIQTGVYSVPGDKHGYNTATGYAAVDSPFNIYGTSNTPGDIILSCMNCHEAHGSENDYMHRRWINDLALGVVVSGVTNERGAHCVPCHTEDTASSTGSQPGGWKETHHGGGFSNDNPYTANKDRSAYFTDPNGDGKYCEYCHGASSNASADFAIPCEDCHYHGSYVDEYDKYTATGQANGVKYVTPDNEPYRRKTF